MTSLAITYQPYLTRAVAVLALMCTLCAFLYGFFLLEAVGHAAARQSAQQEIQTIRERLSGLEAQYLARTRVLTLERAHDMGFVAPAEVSTVYATAAANSLTLHQR